MLWTMVGVLAAGALVAAVGERRQHRRADLDRIGWVPWPAVQLFALFAAVLFLVLALHSN
jgi:hypothetical protein